jgi:thioredoxin reductase
MVAGRINQPQEAEQIIASGQADLTAMTRALIADPELPLKVASGRAEQIRACVACNQACIGHFHMGYPISCIQHPETGRELTFGTRLPVRTAKDVMIVGGGPAGLKAAAVAAERGHRVQLFDAGRRLGGQVLLAELLPGRAEFGGVVTNLSAEAERAGAKLQAGVTVDCDTIAQVAPDVLIVATGARPYLPPLEAGGELPIVDAWEVIRGASLPAGRVVIADWNGDWIGLGLAQMLAQTGRPVTLAANGMGPGEGLQQYVRTSMVAPLIRAKVEILPHVRLYGYDDDSVYFQDTLTNDAVVVDDVAALVVSYGHTSVDDLLNCPNAGQVIAIGDALAPRSVEEAVLDGLRVTHDL